MPEAIFAISSQYEVRWWCSPAGLSWLRIASSMVFYFCRSAAQEEQLCTGAKWGDHSIRERKKDGFKLHNWTSLKTSKNQQLPKHFFLDSFGIICPWNQNKKLSLPSSARIAPANASFMPPKFRLAEAKPLELPSVCRKGRKGEANIRIFTQKSSEFSGCM